MKNRRSIRLRGYNYSQAGAYFITVCAQNRERLFGDIADGQMVLNDAGRMATKCWNEIPLHFPDITLDAFVVMPNHVHGILVITDTVGVKNTVGAKNFSPPTIGSTATRHIEDHRFHHSRFQNRDNQMDAHPHTRA